MPILCSFTAPQSPRRSCEVMGWLDLWEKGWHNRDACFAEEEIWEMYVWKRDEINHECVHLFSSLPSLLWDWGGNC